MNPKTAIDTQERGRVRVEHGTKRIRAFLAGELVADTTSPCAALRYERSPFVELRDAIRLDWNAVDAGSKKTNRSLLTPATPTPASTSSPARDACASSLTE